MGPALQRLLLRPSSFEVLRSLIGISAAYPPAKSIPRWNSQICGRRRASMAAAAREIDSYEAEEEHENSRRTISRPSKFEPQHPLPQPDVEANLPPIPISKTSSAETSISKHPSRKSTASRHRYDEWDESLWTFEQLEFESNLDVATAEPERIRLIDQIQHQEDWKLWACLLEYRKRIHGPSGVRTFWNAIQRRNLRLPTRGFLAEKFWPEFLALGFQDHQLLEEVCRYAGRVLDEHGQCWSRLYVYVIRHFLVAGQSDKTLEWHTRLFELHPPGPKAFAEMCRQVTFKDGDMESLRSIYTQHTHRNAYSKVIPLLCGREDYKSALDWHFFFLCMGDLPSTSKAVEPLVHFLAIYDRSNALKVTKSLVDAGVSFAPGLSAELKDNTRISREMMNLVHGQTLNVSVKKYNDGLGARWFATKWVSLDIAINAVHALGVQEIGPLSLQAIALRELDPKAVVLRINQLRDLGISIGDSLFSRAVEYFARNRKYDLLDGLLNSDQHPDQLEDGTLQESLLASYARNKDWIQYRRTLEIRSLVSKSPALERCNIILRSHVTRGSRTAVMEMLADMQTSGTPVTSKTIAHLIKYILSPRRQGRRPMSLAGSRNKGTGNDLNMAIAILKRIMKTGSFVPILHWREIVRRLGMLGRFDDLENLCRFLASWYGPLGSSISYQPRKFRLPAQIPTSHYLHPLKMLFSVSLQKAIVEWGFIHSLKRRPIHLDSTWRSVTARDTLPDIASGVVLLKELHQRGVHINSKSVRSALFNRLITYFGPGNSNRRYNRYGKAILHGKMDAVAAQIDDALGGKFFTAVDLPKLVQDKAVTRLRRIDGRWRNRLVAEPLSPTSRLGI